MDVIDAHPDGGQDDARNEDRVPVRNLVPCVLRSGRCRTRSSPSPSRRKGPSTTIRLECSAFKEGGTIPKVYTCDGTDTSPPLEWSGVPEAARSLSLIVEDPDAPVGTFTHWVLFNLPSDLKGLSEGIAPGARSS